MTRLEPEPLNLPDALPTDNPLWRYALACWQNPDVVKTCLELQTKGWSVTRILCAGWLGQNGQRFTGVEDAKVTEWRSRVTGSIRSARKSICKQSALHQPLRETLAKAELEAEQTELALAWQTLNQQNPETSAMHNRITSIQHNLLAAAPEQTPDPNLEAMLGKLAEQLATTPSGDRKPC